MIEERTDSREFVIGSTKRVTGSETRRLLVSRRLITRGVLFATQLDNGICPWLALLIVYY